MLFVLQEKETLLQQGFQREAARMQSEIDSLKADMNKQETSQPSTVSKVLDGIGTAAALFLPGFIPKAAGIGLSWLSKRFWKWICIIHTHSPKHRLYVLFSNTAWIVLQLLVIACEIGLLFS